MFLEPDAEVLIAENGAQVAEHLRHLSPERAGDIGQAARRRVLSEHTYQHRGKQVDAVLTGRFSAVAGR
jgi:hypothetical protein